MRSISLIVVCLLGFSCSVPDYTPSSIIGTYHSSDTLSAPGWLDSVSCEETSVEINFQNFDDFWMVNSDYESVERLRYVVDSIQSRGKKVIAVWDASKTSFDCVWTFSNREFYYKDSKGILLNRLLWVDAAKTGLQHQMTQAMVYWVEELGIEGYRCSEASKVPVGYWEALRRKLDDVSAGTVLISDSLNSDYYERAFNKTYSYE